nr:hypothetical protein [Neisseria sp. 74A18]
MNSFFGYAGWCVLFFVGAELFTKAETFAKPSDVDAVQGVAAQRVQTYHIDRQTSEQRTTQKCAADGGFAKVSSCKPPKNTLFSRNKQQKNAVA